MGSKFETRLKKLEAMRGDEVESILDGLNYEQGHALLTCLIAHLEGEEGPSHERLRQSPMNQARYEQVLASIPEGVLERLLAAFINRVARKEAARARSRSSTTARSHPSTSRSARSIAAP
jgi:hypothetical protein